MASPGLAQVKLLMPPAFLRSLDLLAEGRGINRSEYVRALVAEDAVRQAARAAGLTPEQWMAVAIAFLEGRDDAGE